MASEDEKSKAVVKAMMKISKADEIRKETAMMMQPYANWEKYLAPAPLSIAILGHLICISAGQGDFSIKKNSDTKFKYIKYPESFRACLCQVSNEGWHAFNEAHVNMDQIRLLTASIPGRIKVIVQTLFQDVEVVDALLPGQIKSLKSIAEDCTSRAVAVKDKYASVICLVQELLATSILAKKGYEKELEKVKTDIMNAKIKEKAAQVAKELAEKYHNQLKQQTDELFEEYKKNMDEIPTGWEAIGMSIVESFGKIITNIVEAGCNLISGKMGKGPGNGERPFEIDVGLAAIPILDYASILMNNVVKKDGLLNMEKVYDKKNGEVKINYVKNGFLSVKSKLEEQADCRLKKQAIDLSSSGVRVCEKLEEMAKSYQEGTSEERVLTDEIKHLYQQATEFDSLRKSTLGGGSIQPTAPNMAQYQQESGGGSIAIRNAYVKVEQSRETLKASQEAYQKSFEILKKTNQEMTDLLCAMGSFKVKEINFEDALRMLTEGLKALGEVKKQWETMIQFFQMVSNLMDSCLKQKICDFLGTISDVQQIEGYSSHAFVKDLIYHQVFSASNVAHLMHMIADTYTEVSEKYLMDQISSLGRLITLEPSAPEFEAQRNALNQGCKETENAILRMVIQKKEEYDENVEARLKTIDRELKAVLPLVSTEEKKMIKDAVHRGMRNLTPVEEDQFA